jgi:hypothetical protein
VLEQMSDRREDPLVRESESFGQSVVQLQVHQRWIVAVLTGGEMRIMWERLRNVRALAPPVPLGDRHPRRYEREFSIFGTVEHVLCATLH